MFSWALVGPAFKPADTPLAGVAAVSKERFKNNWHNFRAKVGLRCANPTYGCTGYFLYRY